MGIRSSRTSGGGSGTSTSNNTPRAILGGGWDGSDRNDIMYIDISTLQVMQQILVI